MKIQLLIQLFCLKLRIVGDPACDLAIAWTLFRNESQRTFQCASARAEAWNRRCAWAFWKTLIIAAGVVKTNAVEGSQCWQLIDI